MIETTESSKPAPPGPNAKTVMTIYEAFGKGDVAAVLFLCAEDTEWGFNTRESPVPWHATFRSKSQLPRFFETMTKEIDLRAFEPRLLAEAGREVLFQVRLQYRILRNGASVAEDQIQWWSFDPAGKVSRLRHYTDTASVNSAYRR